MKYLIDQEQPEPMVLQQDLQQNLNEHLLQQELTELPAHEHDLQQKLTELPPHEHHLQQKLTELPPQQKKRNTTVSHAATAVAKKSRLAQVASLIEKAISCVDTK